MKKMALLFLLLTNLSFGQTPYLDSTSQWHEHATLTSPVIPDTVFFQDYTYYFNGDSTLTTTMYLKLFRTGIDSAVCNINSGYTISQINEQIGLIREETATKNIYFIPNTQTVEILLYDFGLTLNDTVPYSYGFTNCSSGNVLLVDTFSLGNQSRKRLYVAASSDIGAQYSSDCSRFNFGPSAEAARGYG